MDARERNLAGVLLNDQPVIMKYLYNYLDEKTFCPPTCLKRTANGFIQAASLHLDFAEAANRDGHRPLAYALVNQGLPTIPNKITNEASPYDFDARKSDNPQNYRRLVQ